MQSVLLSIRPKWCELIASGKKTIEVRKTRPKIETPFKCYIYETKARSDMPTFVDEDGHVLYTGRGQIIGEFVCDKISEIGFSPWSHGEYVSDIENLHKASCLNFDEMFSYLEDGVGYGWHISELQIYDNPRKLSDFGRGCDAENIGEIHCRDCKKLVSFDECCEVMCKPLNRPPQSWCYMEDITLANMTKAIRQEKEEEK